MDIIITESQLKYIIKETFNVDYTFDRFNTTFDPKYGPPKVFFNNTVKVSGNRDYETEIYRFTRKDGEVYQFDSRDIGFSKDNGNAFIKLSDFEIEYPEEGDKFREMIELEKKNNRSKLSNVLFYSFLVIIFLVIGILLINQYYFKRILSFIFYH